MEQSILNSTKKILGIDASYTAFDLDILTHINSALAALNQIGVGPEDGFTVVDDTSVWTAFIGSDPKKNNVKTYVYLKVRQVFDPPQTSFLGTAMQEQIRELEWRMSITRELVDWVDPDADDDDEVVVLPVILDGGEP